jgi:hypothetical protein
MATVRESATFPASVHQAESCWYETGRWPQFVDELARVREVNGPWPEVGASVVWESGPAGRGTVTERVIAHQALSGQTVAVEDDAMVGEQTVWFVPAADGVEMVLELTYRIKRRNPLTPLVDLLFIRRLMGASLRRTLSRFGAELVSALRAQAR